MTTGDEITGDELRALQLAAREQRRPFWLVHASQYWRTNPDASPADVARAANVNRSTVARAVQKGRLAAPIVAGKESP